MSDQVMRMITSGNNYQGDSIGVTFLLGKKEYNIFFRSKERRILTANDEAFIACGILPCMKTGTRRLIVDGDVSQRFISALSTIQDIYCMWDPSLHRVEIKAVKPLSRKQSTQRRVGTFFSGGVDSFYTFLKHQDEVTDIILVHGFDIALGNTRLRDETSKKIREVAARFDKNLIEIETNIRKLLNRYIDWGLFGHGAALAALGHLLFPAFHRIYIPATHTYTALLPWGSHPVLDPLWSSETLEFIHDGCEATRVEKVARLSTCEIALKSLRVCWENPNGAYNCGRCEKCLRTMLNLRVNNALDRCPTFDCALDINAVLNVTADSESVRAFIRENLAALKKHDVDDELETALQSVLDKPHRPRTLKERFKESSKKIMGYGRPFPSGFKQSGFDSTAVFRLHNRGSFRGTD